MCADSSESLSCFQLFRHRNDSLECHALGQTRPDTIFWSLTRISGNHDQREPTCLGSALCLTTCRKVFGTMQSDECSGTVPQTVLALRGSDGFSKDPWRVPGVNPRSLGARSCCKNRYLVTPTFAPLERNRGSRAQTHKN